MKKVGSMLRGVVENEEVLAAARAGPVLRRWPEIVGPDLAKRSWPDRYNKGVVWVAVQGSGWAQELRMMREIILQRLTAIGRERGLFVDVRFGIRPLPAGASEVIEEDPQRLAPNTELSIREIADRRLAQWRDEKGT